jgi:arsenate reductase
MSDTVITIYHNPACGTSRNTLALIRNSGVEPAIIHYLETPPSRETLVALIAAMGMPVRDLLRKNVPPFEELGLTSRKKRKKRKMPPTRLRWKRNSNSREASAT